MTPLRQKMVKLMTYRNLSPRTHESYLGAVTRLAEYYNKSPAQISPEEIQNWLMYLYLNKHLAPASVLLISNGVKFLYHQVMGKDDYLLKLSLPKRPQKIPDLLTPMEVHQIILSCKNIRNYAMLSLCYGCGLRLSEVVSVKIKNLDSEHHRLKIEQGKGKKDRVIPMPETLINILRQYWHYYRTPDLLFYGKQAGKVMQTSTLQKIFQSAKKKADITKKGGIHSLRHAYATHQLDAGMPIYQLKDILGHADIRTTMRYLHWCPQTSAVNFDLMQDWDHNLREKS